MTFTETILQIVALGATGVFFGAAFYISLVEHPARMAAGLDVALRQFPFSYRRAARLQASCAIIGSAASIGAWLLGAAIPWLIAGALLFLVVPYTIIVVSPTNKYLHRTDIDASGAATRQHLIRWGRLHWVRTLLSLAAFAMEIAATIID